MWFLDASSGRRAFTRRFGGELLPGGFTTGRLTSRLLGTSHDWKYLLHLSLISAVSLLCVHGKEGGREKGKRRGRNEQ